MHRNTSFQQIPFASRRDHSLRVRQASNAGMERAADRGEWGCRSSRSVPGPRGDPLLRLISLPISVRKRGWGSDKCNFAPYFG